MPQTIDILRVLLPSLYLLALVAYSFRVFRGDERLGRYARPFLRVAVGAHVVEMALRTIHLGFCPVAPMLPFEALGVLALAAALIYLVVEWKTEDHATGPFILAIIFPLQVLCSALGKWQLVTSAGILTWHVVPAIFGVAALSMAALFGLMYLLLLADLKGHRFGVLFHTFPSLEELANKNRRAAWIGVVLTALSLIVMFMTIIPDKGSGILAMPRFIAAISILVIYAATLIFSGKVGLKSRRLAYVSIMGFVAAMMMFPWEK